MRQREDDDTNDDDDDDDRDELCVREQKNNSRVRTVVPSLKIMISPAGKLAISHFNRKIPGKLQTLSAGNLQVAQNRGALGRLTEGWCFQGRFFLGRGERNLSPGRVHRASAKSLHAPQCSSTVNPSKDSRDET